MSTGTPPAAPVPAPAPAPVSAPAEPREVRVVSHSNLYYWWPVWAAGFILGAVSWVEGAKLAVIPYHKGAYSLDIAENHQSAKVMNTEGKELGDPIKLRHASASRIPGVLFFTILLLVLIFTNVPLRGMWSYLLIISVVLLALILHLMDAWDRILGLAALLDIRINAGGYLFFGGVLLIIWLLTVCVFDNRVYIVFGPRQFRVCTSVGDGEQVFDAIGLSYQKQPSDLFRHKILGLGAGDLVVKTTGAQSQHFELPNVLFIDHKIKQIDRVIRTQRTENVK